MRDTESFSVEIYDALERLLATTESSDFFVSADQFKAGTLSHLQITADNPIVQESSSIILEV